MMLILFFFRVPNIIFVGYAVCGLYAFIARFPAHASLKNHAVLES